MESHGISECQKSKKTLCLFIFDVDQPEIKDFEVLFPDITVKRSPAVCMSRCCVSIVKFVFCSSS